MLGLVAMMNFLDAAIRDALDEGFDVEIIRPDTFDGGNNPVQDVIAAHESVGTFHGQYIPAVPSTTQIWLGSRLSLATDFTFLLAGKGDVVADATEAGGLFQLLQSFGKLL